ncbi:MAG: Asd/ArgC dimerization domain-containing protein [Endozoicomonas sp.]
MTRTYDIAVYSADSLAGEALIRQLEEGGEQALPVLNLYPLAEEAQASGTVDFHGQELELISGESFEFTQVDFLFMPAGAVRHAGLMARAVEAGCVIIDGSRGASVQGDVLPVIPGGTEHQMLADGTLEEAAHNRYLAYPGSPASLLLPLLRLVHHQYGLSRINLTLCQPVAGLGLKAVEALRTQTIDLLNGKSVSSSGDEDNFSHRIAYNLLPASQGSNEEGLADVEKTIRDEVLMAVSPELDVRVTCVTAPVFFGDSFVVDLDTLQPVDLPDLSESMACLPAVEVLVEGETATVEDIAGSDRVALSRLRQSCVYGTGLSFWLVADSLRRGAVHGAELARLLIKDFAR